MRARLFVLFDFAVLIALISLFLPTSPISTTVFAQQPAAQPAGRGQGARQAGRRRLRTRQYADIRRAAGRNAGVATGFVFVEKLL